MKALEDLQNNTICIKQKDGIVNMGKDFTDIEKNLVYVQNIIPEDSIKNVVKKGEFCRYLDIVAVPKIKVSATYI